METGAASRAMPARRNGCCIAIAAFAAFAGFACAAFGARLPNDNGCIRAWNTTPDSGSRVWLSAHAGERLQILGGVRSRDTSDGKTVTHEPSMPVCVLTLITDRRMLTVTGRWRDGTVSRWTRQLYPAGMTGIVSLNARVLPDGRITKIYRR